MDISEDYILMCSKAQEIQDNKPNDFYTDNHNYLSIGESSGKINEIDGMQEKGDIIWLPRQDQLQEMLKSVEWFYNENNPSGMMDSLYYIYMCCSSSNEFNYTEYVKQFKSFEQLWLSFVMNEKYNKIWDKNKQEWILKKS
jgi:hypothetical protein